MIDARQGLQGGTLNPEAWGTVVSDGQLHSSEARASHHLRPCVLSVTIAGKVLCFYTGEVLLED